MRSGGGQKSPAAAAAVPGVQPPPASLSSHPDSNGAPTAAAPFPRSSQPLPQSEPREERNGRFDPSPSVGAPLQSSHPPSILSAQFAPSAANSERFGARDVRGTDYRGAQSSSHDVRFGGGGGFSSGSGYNSRRQQPTMQRDARAELELFGPQGDKPRGIEFKNYEDIPVETSGLDVPAPIDQFKELQCHEVLLDNIDLSGYDRPTPVQRYSIPISLAGRDLMACAQTGSGVSATHRTAAQPSPPWRCLHPSLHR